MKLSEVTSEVMHYTTASGLQGIVENQTLWATSSRHLNDHTETQWFFDKRLVDLIEPVMRAHYATLTHEPTVQAALARAGGLEQASRHDTKMFAEAACSTTMDVNMSFITSFSAPFDELTAQHGLLSQWRGYGTDGGYAIVFDAKGLEESLQKEHDRYDTFFGQFGDVYYLGGSDAAEFTQRARLPEISQQEDALISAVSEWLRTGNQRRLDDAYAPMTSLSCTCKHWSFHEEREVRIVAIPMTPKLLRKNPNPDVIRRPLKELKHRNQHGALLPYIELFGHEGDRLPIKRVIIGPHLNQDARQRGVASLLSSKGINADVVKSEIPLRVG